MTKTLNDIAEAMRDIDFCTLSTIAPDGSIASRPMSNNRNVEFDGDSWFFSTDDTILVQQIGGNDRVGVTYLGSPGIKAILGAPGMFIHLEGYAAIVRDKAQFAAHWEKSLDRWYPQGIDTPGLVLLKITASRIHYWDGEDNGEVAMDRVPGRAAG